MERNKKISKKKTKSQKAFHTRKKVAAVVALPTSQVGSGRGKGGPKQPPNPNVPKQPPNSNVPKQPPNPNGPKQPPNKQVKKSIPTSGSAFRCPFCSFLNRPNATKCQKCNNLAPRSTADEKAKSSSEPEKPLETVQHLPDPIKIEEISIDSDYLCPLRWLYCCGPDYCRKSIINPDVFWEDLVSDKPVLLLDPTIIEFYRSLENSHLNDQLSSVGMLSEPTKEVYDRHKKTIKKVLIPEKKIPLCVEAVKPRPPENHVNVVSRGRGRGRDGGRGRGRGNTKPIRGAPTKRSNYYSSPLYSDESEVTFYSFSSNREQPKPRRNIYDMVHNGPAQDDDLTRALELSLLDSNNAAPIDPDLELAMKLSLEEKQTEDKERQLLKDFEAKNQLFSDFSDSEYPFYSDLEPPTEQVVLTPGSGLREEFVQCPVCSKYWSLDDIEEHVDRCLGITD